MRRDRDTSFFFKENPECEIFVLLDMVYTVFIFHLVINAELPCPFLMSFACPVGARLGERRIVIGVLGNDIGESVEEGRNYPILRDLAVGSIVLGVEVLGSYATNEKK